MNRKQILILATVGMLGCERVHSNYCEEAPNHNCKDLVDAPIDAASCSSNASCMAPLGVCDVAGSRTCVECTATDHAACVGVEPVCGADQTCHACKAHSECASEVCLPDGSCAAEGDVAYVDGGAGAGVACTKGAPCKTMTLALAVLPAKKIVKANGVITDAVKTTITGRAVKMFANAGTKWTRGSSGAILEIGNGGTAELYDLEVTNASNTVASTDGIGILIPAGGSAQSLTLSHVTVSQCAGVGISVGGGEIKLDRSIIASNVNGGIAVSGGNFTITNSIVHHNGSSTSNVGGVKLDVAPSASMFAFNTVVDNDAAAGQTRGGGVLCDVAAFSMLNNIIARNRANSDANATTAQTSGQCQSQTSSIQSDFVGLNFKSAAIAPFDYHLLVGSKAIDAATTTSSVVFDIDGNTRPQGAGKDQGADEFKP
ncbi:MAG TPA: right-handed parallel beta-helix repeat-containing protein [Kofleriaceae bacterium]|nr:right-handed parallel beta-helix repeat-containing protein [Kofleriaceae bacterium]